MKRWCSFHDVKISTFLQEKNPGLWNETVDYSTSLEKSLYAQFEGVPTSDFHDDISGGGAAAFELLYFLTRFRSPKVAVETGVAAGWSSRAILDAMKKKMAKVNYIAMICHILIGRKNTTKNGSGGNEWGWWLTTARDSVGH
jgi:hypothetical protein